MTRRCYGSGRAPRLGKDLAARVNQLLGPHQLLGYDDGPAAMAPAMSVQGLSFAAQAPARQRFFGELPAAAPAAYWREDQAVKAGQS